MQKTQKSEKTISFYRKNCKLFTSSYIPTMKRWLPKFLDEDDDDGEDDDKKLPKGK